MRDEYFEGFDQRDIVQQRSQPARENDVNEQIIIIN